MSRAAMLQTLHQLLDRLRLVALGLKAGAQAKGDGIG